MDDHCLSLYTCKRCIVFKQFEGLNFDSLAGKCQNFPCQNFALYGIHLKPYRKPTSSNSIYALVKKLQFVNNICMPKYWYQITIFYLKNTGIKDWLLTSGISASLLNSMKTKAFHQLRISLTKPGIKCFLLCTTYKQRAPFIYLYT